MIRQESHGRGVRSTRACALALSVALTAAGPIWSKKAVPLPVGCNDSADIRTIQSPNRQTTVEVLCGGANPAGTGVSLRVTTGNHSPIRTVIPRDPDSFWRPQEVLWANDSSAFLINGSDSAYAGAEFIVYRIGDEQPTGARVTAAAQRDMVRSFPPCRTANPPLLNCHDIERDPEFNMSAIAWTRGAHAIIVFAEVPCSATYGGIMCEAMGYELEVPSGRILARMTVSELKRRYQSQAAWDIQVPARPKLEP